MKRCTNCVLTEKTPGIGFDDQGVCNYCRSHRAVEYRGEKEFKAILDRHRKPDAKYECICAISGGRDSTYVLLKLVRDYGMKVLAVNYDNPFTSPEARQNVHNAVSKLGVDLITVRPRRDIHRRSFANNFRAWCRRPSLAILPLMCIACKLMWYEILKIARREHVSLVVGGMNRFEDTAYKKALLGVPPDEKWETTYLKSFLGALKEALLNPAYLRPGMLPTVVRSYLFGDPYALGARLLQRNITLLDMFFYIEWKEHEVLSRIRKELDWTSPEDYPSTWRFDCELVRMKDFVYLKTAGVSEKDDFYSKMVRDGLIAREEALHRLERENIIHEPIVRKLSAVAGVRYEDLQAALERCAASSCGGAEDCDCAGARIE